MAREVAVGGYGGGETGAADYQSAVDGETVSQSA